jgi:hypothetical protein
VIALASARKLPPPWPLCKPLGPAAPFVPIPLEVVQGLTELVAVSFQVVEGLTQIVVAGPNPALNV